MIKQYIILRKDAPTITGDPVSPAKLAVMTAHASSAFLLKYIPFGLFWGTNFSFEDTESIAKVKEIKEDVKYWIKSGFTKVLLGANTKDFMKIVSKAQAAGFRENRDFFKINDLCNTELLPDEGSNTCFIALGFRPMEEDLVRPIVKRIQLYK
jgi:peptidyl-tRNA hydrolase